MRLELSEVLACPRCGPPQGIVVVVETSDAGRVDEGFAACPACDSRFPIREGVLWLGTGEEDPAMAELEDAAEPASGTGSRTEPDALPEGELLAALLDCRGEAGCVLLGRGLAPIAPSVASLLARPELVVLAGEGDPPSPPTPGLPITRLRGAPERALPVLSGRFRGVALLGGGGASLDEAVRALAEGGRLVVLQPLPELEGRMSEYPLELLAADVRALVATRVGRV